MAFMFLNRYIDLADAIDENGELMDNVDFANTDIPFDIHLPQTKYLSVCFFLSPLRYLKYILISNFYF